MPAPKMSIEGLDIKRKWKIRVQIENFNWVRIGGIWRDWRKAHVKAMIPHQLLLMAFLPI